ncbi:hypothetical protein ACQR1W_13885 [Bradyrhizobium sp. HKCCYLS1011]|uniref:hypothetical protein n=1 Tax=Bradyrhizobium sp. HKCCYLS1011 TaxID=3420733 RepID=UPI003EB81B62
MRLQHMMIVLAPMLSAGAALADDNRGTMDQQMACTPDVWRLCSAYIPDRDSIVACLKQNTPQLSGPCRAVFEPSAPPQAQQRPARRVAQPRTVPPHNYSAQRRTYDIDDDE